MNSPLRINYEGTLLYSENRQHPAGLFFSGSHREHETFFEEIMKARLYDDVVWDASRHYVAVWYDGADSYMDELTLEEFYHG